MSGGFNLDDYVDVAERIRLFYERWPDGRLQTSVWSLEEVGERLFVVCEAQAFRTADDPQPARGTAWEPIPGPTPYTKDSELMNAETAAWGRAIIAAGIPSKKIASQQEVQARRVAKVTPEQHKIIGGIIGSIAELTPGRTKEDWTNDSRAWCMDNFGKHTRADLTEDEADQLIKYLRGVKRLQEEPIG